MLFLSQVRDLEKESDLPSGLKEYEADTVDVDFSKLSMFLRKLASWANLDHPSLVLLLKGVVVHLLALSSCNTLDPSPLDFKFPREWLDEAKSLATTRMKRIACPSPSGD